MLIYFSSLEHRQKMSNNRIQTLQNSTFSKKYQYNKINFRSNWEVQVAKWLDENNIIWEYESEKCIFNLSSGKHYLY